MTVDQALQEVAEATEAERTMYQVPRDRRVQIMRRRDAAIRRLHEIEDPWSECLCLVCQGDS